MRPMSFPAWRVGACRLTRCERVASEPIAGGAHSRIPRHAKNACLTGMVLLRERAWDGARPRLRQARAAILRSAASYKPTIHFAPRTIAQIAATSTISTMMAANRPTDSKSPSSSR